MKNINRILIPFDLREDSYNAILHAEFIARLASSEIVLLHLVKHESDIPHAQNELNKWADRIRGTFEGSVKTIVEAGDLSTTVDEIAKLQHCGLVLMPTHGMRGMQRITGSLALKVVSESLRSFRADVPPASRRWSLRKRRENAPQAAKSEWSCRAHRT